MCLIYTVYIYLNMNYISIQYHSRSIFFYIISIIQNIEFLSFVFSFSAICIALFTYICFLFYFILFRPTFHLKSCYLFFHWFSSLRFCPASVASGSFLQWHWWRSQSRDSCSTPTADVSYLLTYHLYRPPLPPKCCILPAECILHCKREWLKLSTLLQTVMSPPHSLNVESLLITLRVKITIYLASSKISYF